MDIPKAYDKNRESQIYANWLEKGMFRAEISDKSPYCIMIPPPNITDKLHMGHALNNTIQDVLLGLNVCRATMRCGSQAPTTRQFPPR